MVPNLPGGDRGVQVFSNSLLIRPHTAAPTAPLRRAPGVTVLPAGAVGVLTNFGSTAYNGPCPPAGSGVHRYEFAVWALGVDTVSIAPNAGAALVRATLSGPLSPKPPW